MNEKVKTNTH